MGQERTACVARATNAGDRRATSIIEDGTSDDYRRLAAFHYRSGPPATVARVLRAVDPGAGGQLAGVLVVSYPALWGTWRRAVWPGRFQTGDLSTDARRINRDIRAISRVVVDPRYRGLGIAAGLVRAYLVDPCTPLTEAVTSMGRWCPFFQAAGMTPHELAIPRRDRELMVVLGRAGIRPWQLLDAAAARRAAHTPPLRRALEHWHRRGREITRRGADRTTWEIAMLAGAALSARPIAYSHGR
jgi:GNAT superfamily N-acetyltransferase